MPALAIRDEIGSEELRRRARRERDGRVSARLIAIANAVHLLPVKRYRRQPQSAYPCGSFTLWRLLRCSRSRDRARAGSSIRRPQGA
jgi:hypothetical protein